ncbi:MAG TPA: hypothetical protein VFB27_11710 [Opitutaceae bacterium]|nr:hypothetical protein [Opitutaceae bacterium]
MNKSTKTMLACAALAGLYSGSFALQAHASVKPGTAIVKDDSGKSSCNGKSGCSGKHDCKGQNSCKGQGGCSSGDNGCKGKNSCKGHGGCKSGHA